MNENEGRQLLSELLSKVNASGPENFDEVPVEESAASLVAGKDDELKKSLRIFALRCIAGIAIFFLPTIISFVFSLVSSWASLKGDFNQCQKYVLNVRNSD